MRVSSLSNEQVIRLISRYYLPVWYSRDNYQLGEQDKAAQAEIQRIDRAADDKGGSVCVFLLDPDGSVLATQMVQPASKAENLIALLQRVVDEKKLNPRDPAAVRASTAGSRTAPRPKEADSLVLRIWTRFEGNRADYGLSQDWVELSAAEAAGFAPPPGTETGAKWSVPDEVAGKIFRYFYPPGPSWNAEGSKVVNGTLTATAASVSADEIQVNLRGTLKLSFSFGNSQDTPGEVTAKVVGVARYNQKQKALTSLEMITDDAQYVWHFEGKPLPERMTVAVQLQSHPHSANRN
jgi:hypothetical protein